MQLLRTFTPLVLLLAFLGQQVSLSSALRHRKGGSKAVSSSNPNKPKGSGKFKITKDNMHCSWRSEDVGDTVRLSVKCENPEARVKGGTTDMACQYNGKPELCSGYKKDSKTFWKQVVRAFKKLQQKVCLDEGALVRTGLCKRAHRDAHFKLDIFSSVASAQSGGDPDLAVLKPQPTRSSNSSAPKPTACVGREQQQKKAEENCGRWASLCTLFFTMVQSEDC